MAMEKYLYPTEREYMEWMNKGLETPTKDLFTRDYDAVHLFVYLTERSTWRTVRDTWNHDDRKLSSVRHLILSPKWRVG